MEGSIIEQQDRARYRVMGWFTAGFGFWFGLSILHDFVQDSHIEVIISLLAVVSSIVFWVSIFKLNQLSRKLAINPHLKRALNNEYITHLKARSFVTAFWVLIIVTGIMIVISSFTTVSGLQASKIILYCGIMAVLVSFLVFHRK